MRPDDLQKIFEKDCATKDIHLLDPIGHGTFADVYLYEMRDPDGLFIEDGALKIIDIDKNYKNDYYANPAIGGAPLYYINKCHREYNHVSKLFKECTPEELTHIVPIKSCQLLEYHDIHLLLLFMPYYPQHLENRQHVVSNYNEDDILDIAIQCAEGLRTLHEHQMIHKDIKPNNIFMGNENGKVIYRIGDFGCSRDTTTNNLETSTPLGTLYYASPEAFFGEYYFSSDIYSLGILIYWLCNNYNYPDELSTLQHAEVTIPRMENGSDRLWHIVQKATQHHYQNRYQNAAELLDALYPLQQAQKETIPETDNHQEDILQASIGFKEDRSFVNYEQTFAYYGEKAVNNDCEAMRELAFMYYYGFGVEQDEEQCLALLRSACEDLQDTQAAFELAKIYDFGQEKLRNKQKALEYYETAAYQGCIEAFYFLSHCYTDKEKALELLTTGAQKGDPKAKFALAAIYQGKIKDFKIKTDIQKAVMIYEELSEGGHLEARKELAEIYIQNHQSEKGMTLLKETANSNLMEACLSLGEIYENGSGVLADYDLAKFYYEKAQKIFFDQEINNVGKFYVNGRYIFLNYAQAKDYYLKHDERKEPYSTYMLAIMNTYHLAMRLNHMQARKMFNEVITGTHQINEITEKASAFLGYFDEMGYGSTSRNLDRQNNIILITPLTLVYIT